MAALQQIFGTPPLPLHKFSGDVATIGRHDECDVVLDSPAVSRYHVKIFCENNRYFIEDLNSRNGTSVNGEMISARTLLNDGDQVEISTLPFKFLTEDSLTEASGSWGVKPDVVSLSNAGSDSDEDSLRRMQVGPGDQISNEQLGTDPVHQNQVIGRIQLADGGGAWPVVNNATLKLNHTLRLLYSLRQTTHRSDVFSRTLQVLFDVFAAATRVSILIRNADGDGIEVGAAVARHATDEVRICLPIVRTAMQSSEALLYAEHAGKSSEEPSQSSASEIMVTPLVGLVGQSIGAIQMDSSHGGKTLTTEDLEQLVVLSHVVAFALEQVLATELHLSRVLAEQNASSAHQLQAGFRPSEPPFVTGYRFAHELVAASNVAGDLVDYIRLPDGRLACLLIDVPGRGLEATRLMVVLSRLLTGTLSETGSPAAALTSTVETLRQRIDNIPLLISVGIMLLDPEKSMMSIAVAGPCQLFHVRADEVLEICDDDFPGPPLGADADSWLETEIQLQDDDLLLLFSDGIAKLSSPDRKPLSRDGQANIIAESAKGNRSVFETRLLKRLEEYRGESVLDDDLAFVMVHRKRNAETIDALGVSSMESETMDA